MDLSCAAAVGSLSTVKQLLSAEGPPVCSLPLYLKNKEFALFSDPLQAAASNGYLEVLTFLLSTLEKDPGLSLRNDRLPFRIHGINLSLSDDSLPFRIHGVMLAAIQSKHSATILAVSEFEKKHKFGLHLGRSF
jgi:hypothetical protein